MAKESAAQHSFGLLSDLPLHPRELLELFVHFRHHDCSDPECPVHDAAHQRLPLAEAAPRYRAWLAGREWVFPQNKADFSALHPLTPAFVPPFESICDGKIPVIWVDKLPEKDNG